MNSRKNRQLNREMLKRHVCLGHSMCFTSGAWFYVGSAATALAKKAWAENESLIYVSCMLKSICGARKQMQQHWSRSQRKLCKGCKLPDCKEVQQSVGPLMLKRLLT
ncbi:hypothetical protein T10_2779 [Trichinella papuae]|uniref:Uncharacterized protein n=1 Tax=Trichinella papuae TaxID=268474 RepID=A0A0V1N7Z4_9BILA|nr:hypothetical protein T10_2779 [Trichinella papuae]